MVSDVNTMYNLDYLFELLLWHSLWNRTIFCTKRNSKSGSDHVSLDLELDCFVPAGAMLFLDSAVAQSDSDDDSQRVVKF